MVGKYGWEVWWGSMVGSLVGKYGGEVKCGIRVGKYGGEAWWRSMVGKYGVEV